MHFPFLVSGFSAMDFPSSVSVFGSTEPFLTTDLRFLVSVTGFVFL